MTQYLLAVVAIYLIAVGFQGNGEKMLDKTATVGKGFLPWVVVIGAIGLLGMSQQTEKLAYPFFGLMLLAMVLQDYQTISSSIDKTLQAFGTNIGGKV